MPSSHVREHLQTETHYSLTTSLNRVQIEPRRLSNGCNLDEIDISYGRYDSRARFRFDGVPSLQGSMTHSMVLVKFGLISAVGSASFRSANGCAFSRRIP